MSSQEDILENIWMVFEKERQAQLGFSSFLFHSMKFNNWRRRELMEFRKNCYDRIEAAGRKVNRRSNSIATLIAQCCRLADRPDCSAILRESQNLYGAVNNAASKLDARGAEIVGVQIYLNATTLLRIESISKKVGTTKEKLIARILNSTLPELEKAAGQETKEETKDTQDLIGDAETRDTQAEHP